MLKAQKNNAEQNFLMETILSKKPYILHALVLILEGDHTMIKAKDITEASFITLTGEDFGFLANSNETR
jgi:hypothetical protein